MLKVEDVQDILALLEQERTAQGKTKRQLCSEAGLSAMTFNALQTRGTGGTVKSLLAFCDALGIQITMQRKQ
jgi:transcriptional regulator with XRE-family HTH domain